MAAKDGEGQPPPIHIPTAALIERAGGVRALARKLGLTHTAVEKWKAKGVVPDTSLRTVLRYYRAEFPREYHLFLQREGEEDPHQLDLFDDL